MIPVLVTIIAGISILLFIYLAVLVILKPEMVSVRWGRGFPHLPSALLNLTARTLVFSHILPTAGRIRDFHPLERAHEKQPKPFPAVSYGAIFVTAVL